MLTLALGAMAGCETSPTRPAEPAAPAASSGSAMASSTAPESTTPTPAPASAQSSPAATFEDSEFAALVAYGNWLRQRSSNDLKPLLADAEARANAQGQAIDRLRLALLLSLPQASFRDDVRALELIEQVIDTDRSEAALFAYTLRWDLQNRLNLHAQFERAITRERQQRALLKQKLDDLKAIEQQIHRRESKPPKSTP